MSKSKRWEPFTNVHLMLMLQEVGATLDRFPKDKVFCKDILDELCRRDPRYAHHYEEEANGQTDG